jgi:hypothetical protein
MEFNTASKTIPKMSSGRGTTKSGETVIVELKRGPNNGPSKEIAEAIVRGGLPTRDLVVSSRVGSCHVERVALLAVVANVMIAWHTALSITSARDLAPAVSRVCRDGFAARRNIRVQRWRPSTTSLK